MIEPEYPSLLAIFSLGLVCYNSMFWVSIRFDVIPNTINLNCLSFFRKIPQQHGGLLQAICVVKINIVLHTPSSGALFLFGEE